MQTSEFDPQPLLQVMADSIVADYGRQAGVQIAERAISQLRGAANKDALQIWLDVHALLHARPILNQNGHTLH
jgi:hypothetical protein